MISEKSTTKLLCSTPMKRKSNIISNIEEMGKLLFLALIVFSSCQPVKETKKVTLYKNAYVFDGMDFVKRDFIVKDGLFFFNSLIPVHSEEDLSGKYVIPPFGDAHTHNFDDVQKMDSLYRAYLDEGTFYVQVLTNHYSSFKTFKDSIVNGPIDVAFAHGGLTSTGGHPHALYETRSLGMDWRAMLLPQNRRKIRNSRNVENDAYYLLDGVKDVDVHWEEIISKEPSILKIYISDFERRQSEIEAGNIGTYGLAKDVAEAVIAKARTAGLTIYAHIETVADFTWALNNGVTHFAHMPGYGGGYGRKDLSELVVPDSVLLKAAINNVVITPTVSFTKYYSQTWSENGLVVDSILLKEKQIFLKNQLRRMHKAGIHLALGADQNGFTLMEEVEDLIQINAFSNKELLNILAETPKHIFPERMIGKIEDGYEASFLVLDDNPLSDIKNLKKISKRVKQGKEL